MVDPAPHQPPRASRGNPPLERSIEESKQILELRDDWDDDGSKGYDEATWLRAVGFLRHYAGWAEERFGVQVPAPRLLPGPDGAIDVHWLSEKFELLVTFPADASLRAQFYGDDFKGSFVKR